MDRQFTMEPIEGTHPVSRQLIAEQCEPAELSIYTFRQIRHAIVPVLHQIGNQLGILAVILELAVIFDLLGLLDSVRIDLDNADAVGHQPRCKAEPVMSGRLEADDDLVLVAGSRKFQHPILGRSKAFAVIAKGKCLFADFPATRVNGPEIMCFAADVAANNQHAVVDEADFVILGKLSSCLEILP